MLIWQKILVMLIRAFPAFGYRNFQLYFVGQLISLIGTWLQIVAQGWLVLQLTNSAFYVGLVATLGSLPVLFFSLFGGVIVDRLPKKQILMFTQTSEMVLAAVLGILTILGRINVYEIGILAFLLGTVTALDLPARQAFIVEMVGKKDLPSAIALGSGMFNTARIIGPAMAGFLIYLVGTGGVFLVNSASYIAVIVAFLYIKVKSKSFNIHPRALVAIGQGIKYSFGHPVIQTLLVLTAVNSIFGWSFTTILPVVVRNEFGRGAEALGFLNAAGGIGAVFGILLVSAFSKRIKSSFFIIGGNTLFAVSIFLFSLTANFPSALFFVFFAGFGIIAQFSMVTATIQRLVGDSIRGRVMSIYTLMFLGMAPVGNFQVGIVAERYGAPFAIRLGAVVIFIFGILYAFRVRKRGKIR